MFVVSLTRCRKVASRLPPQEPRLVRAPPLILQRFTTHPSHLKPDCHGALLRAGIQRPKVTITADDPRLKRGKPFPDPFLLAAKELGYPIERCLVFEDSPSGIKAGVVSGAKTIAVCTSHPGWSSHFHFPSRRNDKLTSTNTSTNLVEKINDCGAHYIVPSLDCVHAYPQKDGTIRIGKFPDYLGSD